MTGERGGWNFAVSVADLDCGIIVDEEVAVDLVVITEEANAKRVDEIVAVNLAVVAMAQGELAEGVVAKRIKAIGDGRSLV